MAVELLGRYLPRDRRDLSHWMVGDSFMNVISVCDKLKLFKEKTVDIEVREKFIRKLYKLVKRRHTHLWGDQSMNSKLEIPLEQGLLNYDVS